MRGYGQFCPEALGAEVVAERWTPLILRELLAGSHRFSDPGFDTDLCVGSDVRTFTRVYLGQISIAHALGDGSVTMVGRSDLRRAFSSWIGLSPYASPRA